MKAVFSHFGGVAEKRSDKDIVINGIDEGKSFNWGKTSKDYAKYRDAGM